MRCECCFAFESGDEGRKLMVFGLSQEEGVGQILGWRVRDSELIVIWLIDADAKCVA
jgi:hypothetical protein